jgi:hypothetical protein
MNGKSHMLRTATTFAMAGLQDLQGAGTQHQGFSACAYIIVTAAVQRMFCVAVKTG